MRAEFWHHLQSLHICGQRHFGFYRRVRPFGRRAHPASDHYQEMENDAYGRADVPRMARQFFR